jgi:hypothetical protein
MQYKETCGKTKQQAIITLIVATFSQALRRNRGTSFDLASTQMPQHFLGR